MDRDPPSVGTSRPGSASNSNRRPPDPAAATTETFAFLAVEEFLMRKGMADTLASFRREWPRPDEASSMLAWYDVALKLRLPEHANANVNTNINTNTHVQGGTASPTAATTTVIDTLLRILLDEAAVRSRRNASEVAVRGLAPTPQTVPMNISVSQLTNGFTATTTNVEGSPTGERFRRQRLPSVNTKTLPISDSSNVTDSVRKPKHKHLSLVVSSKDKTSIEGPAVTSAENWVPEIVRLASMGRDILVAKQGMRDIIARETTAAREMKQFLVSDIQRAKNAEELNMTHKQRCGCCLIKFLPVNLPLKVSQKAILDIRVKWMGGLTSETVFVLGSSSPSAKAPQSLSTPDGFSASWKADLKEAERLRAVPRCYDDVRVCRFCSQFFQQQDAYRPSYRQIVGEERRVAQLEAERREKEFWDPLKMVEKDRETELENEAELETVQRGQAIALTRAALNDDASSVV